MGETWTEWLVPGHQPGIVLDCNLCEQSDTLYFERIGKDALRVSWARGRAISNLRNLNMKDPHLSSGSRTAPPASTTFHISLDFSGVSGRKPQNQNQSHTL